jgi:hypothetical protein
MESKITGRLAEAAMPARVKLLVRNLNRFRHGYFSA